MYYRAIKEILESDLMMDWVGSGMFDMLADPDVPEERKKGARYVMRRRQHQLVRDIQRARKNGGFIEIGPTYTQLNIAPVKPGEEWPHYHANTLGDRSAGPLNTAYLLLGAAVGLPIVDVSDLVFSDYEGCPQWGVDGSTMDVIHFLVSRGARAYKFSDERPHRQSYEVGATGKSVSFVPGRLYGKRKLVETSKKLRDEHGDYWRFFVSSNVSAWIFTARIVYQGRGDYSYNLYHHGNCVASFEDHIFDDYKNLWHLKQAAIMYAYRSDKWLREFDPVDKLFDPAL